MVQILPVPGPKARAYVERDTLVISPSYGRPYPFVMDHGRGSEVWDVDGYRFIDFTTGIAVCATGHSHPEVVHAVQEQATRFIHMSGTDFYYPLQVELAEKLNEIAPISEACQVFLTNSGTESIEAALKLARYATRRPHVLAFVGGFHGRTYGSMSLSGSKAVHRAGCEPLVPAITHVPYAYCYRCPINLTYPTCAIECVRTIERTVFARLTDPSQVAAIFVEPIQGEGGYVIPPREFFPILREICDKHGILLVVDEVQSGFGRTGKMFAVEHSGVEPDIVAVAKGIASGMPLGAMIARKSLMTWPPGAHANTFGGNPLACAAALTTIRLIQNGYMQNAALMGDYILAQLRKMAEHHRSVGDVRGKGLMIGLEIVEKRATKAPAHDLRDAVVYEAFRRGLLVLGAGPNTLRLMPALNVPKPIVDEMLEILEAALAAAEGQHGLA
ncbi:MAG: acetyl ornithine aminotransferase family protein [Anaerolineae bacterium]|nr:acetyl ornithine aminotransferase family protein [Anaerolineae bacterium]